ncbi:hypothetical protein BDR03DRAFT_944029 [Suillus americanus]|nr:hypothetical protein BDR03DRAFT_944029 [Suillus americanus]
MIMMPKKQRILKSGKHRIRCKTRHDTSAADAWMAMRTARYFVIHSPWLIHCMMPGEYTTFVFFEL